MANRRIELLPLRVSSPPPSSPAAQHLPALDGVRGLAIALVLACHGLYGHAPGGFLGVELFFVLSGFLITSILRRDLAERGLLDLRRFWTRRLLRLYPALIAAVLLAGALWPIGEFARAPLGFPASAAAALLNGATFFERSMGKLTHTWSLSVEAQFYLAWPPLLWLAVRTRRPIFCTALLLLAGALWRAVMFRRGLLRSWDLYAFTPVRLDGLLAGAILALLPRESLEKWGRALQRIRLAEIVLAALLLATLTLSQYAAWLYLGGLTGIALLLAAFLATLLAGPQTLAVRFFQSPPLVWLGRRSYGIYLYHFPIFAALEAERIAGDKLNLLWVSLLRVAFSILLAAASWRWLEQPFLRLSRSARGKEDRDV